MIVTIDTLPEMYVAAIRHVGPYHEIGQAFRRLDAIAGVAGLWRFPGACLVGIYHDDPQRTPAAELRSDAGIAIPRQAPLPAGLTETRIAAGRYAHVAHVGSYEMLPALWAKLWTDWLPASGERPGARPSVEIYRNTPADTPLHALRTDLYLPLA
jgi:AraC family transcriptional regulator